ncbi:MAG: hypothetical protein EXR05_00800 [Acetobacteraceae bacterium]|nr:hypothetical protein [Acetobacteraceae bacterium]MSP30588.1 hypothetical protein [Acetobacteraceae bacterium]
MPDRGAAAQPYQPLPALYQEKIPRPYAPSLVWQPGHWQWNGLNYVWVRGRYIPVRPQYRQRVHGHWEQGRMSWRWVEGHWR